MRRKSVPRSLVLAGLILGITSSSFLVPEEKSVVFGATAEELRSAIAEKNNEIKKLEGEIRLYESEIAATKLEARTLESTIREIDITRKKLAADINVTARKIETITLTIEKLGFEIGDKEERIGGLKETVAGNIRDLREVRNHSLVEAVFSTGSISEFWGELDTLRFLQEGIRNRLAELQSIKTELETSKSESQRYHWDLVKTKTQLADQKYLADLNQKKKTELLRDTNNKQSNFQKLLNEKLARKRAFEAELADAEAALKTVLDPGSIPTRGAGILAWPVDVVNVTQEFGDTSFARANPGIYGGGGHNGVDFGGSRGSAVHAARSGTVVGIGNTDATCPRASYGKWILIAHDNGLSTLYAHLDLIRAEIGQRVGTGDTIGYMGDTGYATGPHLHFTLFVSSAVEIGPLKSRVCSGAVYTIPLLTKQGGYLNPSHYLPKL